MTLFPYTTLFRSAVWSDDADRLTVCEREIDAVQHGQGAETLANVNGGENRRFHGLALVCLQSRRDGHVAVGRVLADDEVDGPLGDTLLPLPADDRGRNHVRDR